jgi:hypothetical protein
VLEDAVMDFEELRCTTPSTGQHHKGIGILKEEEFPDEEIIQGHPFMHIGIGFLLYRKFDITAYTGTTGLIGPLVGSLHNARAASGHYGKPGFHNGSPDCFCHFIIFMSWQETGGSKDSHTWAYKMKFAEAFDELENDLEGEDELTGSGLWAFQVVELVKDNFPLIGIL